jgi:hypothetical protein
VLKNNRRIADACLVAVLAALLLARPSGSPAAASTVLHEIPGDVTIQAIIKPEGRILRLLVRVPLTAMQDFEFPLFGPGYLDIARADPMLRDAAMQWIGQEVEVFEDGRALQGQELVSVLASIPSDKSFATYDEALAHISGPRLPEETQLYWQQAMLDLLFEYPIESDESEFSIRPGIERLALRVVTVLRFLPPSGVVRAFQYNGDMGLVRLDPRWHQAAFRFVQLGFLHILDGIDHLLFLLCLVIPFRRLKPLVVIVTAFTVAHSITLVASAFGLAPDTLWFPPLVETLIAASIVYMALENIVGKIGLHRRWAITLGFGLIHGFGFSFALRETLQFAGSHMLMSLLSFNVGVELGQLLVLMLMVPVLEGFFKYAVAERMGTIILSALVAHTGWHWMSTRASALVQYQFRRPAFNAALLMNVLGWVVLIAIVSGAGWWVYGLLRQADRPSDEGERIVVGQSAGAEE